MPSWIATVASTERIMFSANAFALYWILGLRTSDGALLCSGEAEVLSLAGEYDSIRALAMLFGSCAWDGS